MLGIEIKVNDENWNEIMISKELTASAFNYIGDDSQVKVKCFLRELFLYFRYDYSFNVHIYFEDYRFDIYAGVDDTNKLKSIFVDLCRIKDRKVMEVVGEISIRNSEILAAYTDSNIHAKHYFAYDFSRLDRQSGSILVLDENKPAWDFSDSSISIIGRNGELKLETNSKAYTLTLEQARKCAGVIASHPRSKEIVAQAIEIVKTYAPGIEEFISANFPEYNHLKNNNPTDYTVFAGGELINLDEIIKSMSNSQEEFQKSKN